MAGDGMHISEYDPSVADAILGEAAHLLRNIGFSARHSILIGGLVPGLLVLDPGPGSQPHIGTADVDICLSVALVEGDTAEYDRIEAGLRKAGFGPTDKTFAWKRTSGLGIKVEFFCPAADGRPAGSLFLSCCGGRAARQAQHGFKAFGRRHRGRRCHLRGRR